VFKLNYEVAYLSRSGNTAVLAEALAGMFSDEKVHLTDLSQDDAAGDADVYLIGYGVNRGTFPVKIMDTLELAEGKTVLLFCTGGVDPTTEYQKSVERKVLPFLPDECDYRGLFLCAGQFPDEVIQNVQEVLRRDPDNAQARSLLEQAQKARTHPDKNDLANLRKFVREKLSK
jgi:flavodoxin